jgi:hypothetical protein
VCCVVGDQLTSLVSSAPRVGRRCDILGAASVRPDKPGEWDGCAGKNTLAEMDRLPKGCRAAMVLHEPVHIVDHPAASTADNHTIGKPDQ